MPRSARIILPDYPHHILNRSNNKEIIFSRDENFIFFLREVKKYKEKFKIKIYHYCIMPTHYHFLLEPSTFESLAKFMQALMLVYAQYVQREYNRIGHIWQERYKSSVVEKEDYFNRCSYYIENNPRRAGLVKDLKDWPWSSYQFYAFGKFDSNIDVESAYLNLGATSEERQQNYRKYIMKTSEENYFENIRQGLNQGIFGSEGFINEIVERFKIKLKRVGQRGRPRK